MNPTSDSKFPNGSLGGWPEAKGRHVLKIYVGNIAEGGLEE